MQAVLEDLTSPVWAVRTPEGKLGLTSAGTITCADQGLPLIGMAAPLLPESLGDAGFLAAHGVRYAYAAGAMANGIASTRMVITLGQAGFLGSYGAAGMIVERLEEAITEIQSALPNGPYAFNLINSPNEPAMERNAVECYLRRGVHTIEASAYLDLTAPLVQYRVAGLRQLPNGEIQINNRVIGKCSRKEVARRFLQPAPTELLKTLVSEGKITAEQAHLAQFVPMADDLTIEADSGGHTDRRPLVNLIPSLIALRDQLQQQHQFVTPVRIGAAGGIGSPAAALAAFSLGAAYVVTGSINQACIESGASEHTRKLLSQVEMTDVTMAPAADMFEMGVKVQVLKRGTMFAMRAGRLYELYTRYNSIEELPAEEREKLERTIFRRNLDEVWEDTARFFQQRDPRQIERALKDPHQKMALIFRWYLGLSSRWSNQGEVGREMDYQIWCGPSMGAFNDWVRGSYLEAIENRRVADVAQQLMRGTAYLQRIEILKSQGIPLPASLRVFPIRPLH
ncbi:MAG: PfaD family polyunsaturated fatty acid/polyketide biosynthesis protein [Longilinea sp.]|nr:PfaD family polyunsaturated fatty acid/polyketide biosynthesis protein [Longilinea sp.]